VERGRTEFADTAGMLAILRAAAVDEVGEQNKNREVEDGIDTDGDAKKPAKGPGQGLMCGGHEEFRNLQAGRHQGNERDGLIGFAGDRPGEREKPHQQAEYGGENPAEE